MSVDKISGDVVTAIRRLIKGSGIDFFYQIPEGKRFVPSMDRIELDGIRVREGKIQVRDMYLRTWFEVDEQDLRLKERKVDHE